MKFEMTGNTEWGQLTRCPLTADKYEAVWLGDTGWAPGGALDAPSMLPAGASASAKHGPSTFGIVISREPGALMRDCYGYVHEVAIAEKHNEMSSLTLEQLTFELKP